MNKLTRPLVVACLCLVAFLAPTSLAYSLWSTSATATLAVTTGSPAATTFALACGAFADPAGNGVSNSYYSVTWAASSEATTYAIRRGTSILATQPATGARTHNVLRGNAGVITIDALDSDAVVIATSNNVNITTSSTELACTVAP